MKRLLYRSVFVSLVWLSACGHQATSAVPCVATEQALLDVTSRWRSAKDARDVAAIDRLLDDNMIGTNDVGAPKAKKDLLAEYRQPEGNVHVQRDPQLGSVRVSFTNDMGILSFIGRWTDHDKVSGINWGATSALTYVFACRHGEWRMAAYQETGIPNKNRQPFPIAANQLDDYVGRYHFAETGAQGEISITRKGDQLFESWPGDATPTEILPGTHDTFFIRGDASVALFVRDKSGKVTGILYTLGDGEVEAKRVS